MFKRFWIVGLIALFMGTSGVTHLARPEVFAGFVFAPLPALPVIYASGLLHLSVAGLALYPQTRHIAGLAFAAICAAYMPLHIWDLFRPDPVIAPVSAALLRIVVQVFFIWAGLKLWRQEAP